MKRSFLIIIAVLLTASIWAQSPQKMNYQAVIRDSDNALVKSHAVGMRVSILQGVTPVYVETHATTSNANGLVTVEIGDGSVISGDFTTIDWSAGEYSIKTETDPTGGTNYAAIVGTSQLLSVPYALYSKTSEDISGTIAASKVSDFQTSVTNNAAVVLNTAKVTNATHTGDVIGSGALTLATVNSNVGTFNNITINAKGLATAGSNVTYLILETDPNVKAINGIVKSNGTTISSAAAGTDYLTPTGSAASLTDFPVLNQNTTGNAATVTTNANLTGEVTSTGNASTITNNAVTNAKLATVSTSTLKGRVTAGTGNVEDLSATQVRTLLNVADGANNYTHPTGDGNLHVPATGTTNNGKVLTAGATAGALTWETPTTDAGVRYLGEEYDGGIIFYIYKGSDGLEHGLIVSKTETTAIWSGSSLVGADRTEDGVYNMTLMPTGVGTARTWVEALGAGWYLPSIDELSLLWHSRYHVNKTARNISSTSLSTLSIYWSSTETSATGALPFVFNSGNAANGNKSTTYSVRAVRAF